MHSKTEMRPSKAFLMMMTTKMTLEQIQFAAYAGFKETESADNNLTTDQIKAIVRPAGAGRKMLTTVSDSAFTMKLIFFLNVMSVKKNWSCDVKEMSPL